MKGRQKPKTEYLLQIIRTLQSVLDNELLRVIFIHKEDEVRKMKCVRHLVNEKEATWEAEE
jgi:hypothetical protein